MKPTAHDEPSFFKSLMKQYSTPIWMLMWRHVPEQSRRMCYLTSLYAYLTGCNEDEMERLNTINKALHLSRDVNALRFPAMIAPFIWKIKTNRMDLTEGRVEQQIGRLMRLTPCWLRYGDDQLMHDDLQNLLKLCGIEAKYCTAA